MALKAKLITIDEYQRLLDGAEIRMLRGTNELLAYEGSRGPLCRFIALVDGDGMLLILDDKTNEAVDLVECGALARADVRRPAPPKGQRREALKTAKARLR